MCSEITCYSGNGNGYNTPDGIRNKVSFLSTSIRTQYVVSGRVRGRFSLWFGPKAIVHSTQLEKRFSGSQFVKCCPFMFGTPTVGPTGRYQIQH